MYLTILQLGDMHTNENCVTLNKLPPAIELANFLADLFEFRAPLVTAQEEVINVDSHDCHQSITIFTSLGMIWVTDQENPQALVPLTSMESEFPQSLTDV